MAEDPNSLIKKWIGLNKNLYWLLDFSDALLMSYCICSFGLGYKVKNIGEIFFLGVFC
jgi:hypothetical protein